MDVMNKAREGKESTYIKRKSQLMSKSKLVMTSNIDSGSLPPGPQRRRLCRFGHDSYYYIRIAVLYCTLYGMYTHRTGMQTTYESCMMYRVTTITIGRMSWD